MSGKKHEKKSGDENASNIYPVSGRNDRYRIKSHLQHDLVVKKVIIKKFYTGKKTFTKTSQYSQTY